MLNIQPDTFKGTLNSDAPGANEAFADVQDSLDDHETRVAAAESKLATVTAGAAVASVSGTGALSFTAGANPAGSIAAASASVPGTMSAADFAKLVGQLANDGVPVVTTSYLKAVDWLAAGPFVLVPAKVGYYFLAQQIKTFITVLTGTATGNHQYSIGNNANQNNVTTLQTVTFAGINASAALIPLVGVAPNVNGGNEGYSSNTNLSWKQALVPTGLTAYSGYILATGVWIPV